jgi:hypothetical protein
MLVVVMGSSIALPSWECSDVQFVLPTRAAALMLARAQRLSLRQGGRFQVCRGSIVLLWSAAPRLDPHSRPVAGFSLVWGAPDGEHATVRQVAWASGKSSEEEAWRAIDFLRGPDDL